MSYHCLKIPEAVKLETGPNDFPRLTVTGVHANATVYCHGAHVALFQPHGQQPVLFMSGASRYADGQPIRGGVPVIFPWFGPHSTDSSLPAHGTVRLVDWELIAATQRADGIVEVAFALQPMPEYRLQYRINIGRQLELALEVRNTGMEPARFEEALHTYLAVRDCRQCTVTGLENAVYDSTVEGVTGMSQGSAPIRFTAEIDRLYLGTRATCVLHDPGWQRRIMIKKTGSDCTVIWNPWTVKAKAMPDFGDDEWPGMVCIETVNARAHAVALGPGQSHTMSAAIRVEPL